MKYTLNKLIDRVLHYYGIPEDVTIKFSKAGQSNVGVQIDNVTKKLSAGLISKETALKELNGDLTSEQIKTGVG